MIFDLEEEDMHPVFREQMEARRKEMYASYLFHEVRTSNACRADFVLATVDLDRAWERVACYGHDEPRPPEYFRAFHIARDQCPMTEGELYERAEVTDEPTEEHISWLVDNNYLLEDSDGWYRFQYPPGVLSDVTVFELKRKDWDDGLSQAKKYRRMIGTQAYVVMAEDFVSRAKKNLDRFKNDGIGLLSIDEETITHHLGASESRCEPARKRHRRRLDERAFDAFLEEHPPGEYDRLPADTEIVEHRNRYKTELLAKKTGEAFEQHDG